MRWTPDRMDQLERAVRDGRRVAFERRGTEYVVVAVRLSQRGGRDCLVARLPMTGEELTFVLEELDRLEIL